jgi:predicted secreted Zn-dependent protease
MAPVIVTCMEACCPSRSPGVGRRVVSLSAVVLCLAIPASLSAIQSSASSAAEAAGAYPPAVAVIAVDSVYQVHGATPLEVRRAIDSIGPRVRGEHKLAMHRLRWSLDYQLDSAVSGECSVTGLRIVLRSVIVLPEWTGVREQPETVRADWNRFLTHLRQHESEHRAIAIRIAGEIARDAADARAADCLRVHSRIGDIRRRLRDDLAAAQADLDRRHVHYPDGAWPPRRRLGTDTIDARHEVKRGG